MYIYTPMHEHAHTHLYIHMVVLKHLNTTIVGHSNSIPYRLSHAAAADDDLLYIHHRVGNWEHKGTGSERPRGKFPSNACTDWV